MNNDTSAKLQLGIAMGALSSGKSSSEAVTEAVDTVGRMQQHQVCVQTNIARERTGPEIIWRLLGFRFEEDDPEGQRRDVVQPAVLPEGWSIEPTSHYIHNEILGPNGEERGHLIFKPDWRDRNASAYLNCRYYATHESPKGSQFPYLSKGQIVDRMTGKVIAESDYFTKDMTLYLPEMVFDASHASPKVHEDENVRIILKYLDRIGQPDYLKYGIDSKYDKRKSREENLRVFLRTYHAIMEPKERKRLGDVANMDANEAFLYEWNRKWFTEHAPAYVNLDVAMTETRKWLEAHGATEEEVLRFHLSMVKNSTVDRILRISSEHLTFLYW